MAHVAGEGMPRGPRATPPLSQDGGQQHGHQDGQDYQPQLPDVEAEAMTARATTRARHVGGRTQHRHR